MRRAQAGVGIIFVFTMIIIGAAWFAFIGEWFTTIGQIAVDRGATGGWAFFITHLNLWWWIAYLLVLSGATLFGGGG